MLADVGHALAVGVCTERPDLTIKLFCTCDDVWRKEMFPRVNEWGILCQRGYLAKTSGIRMLHMHGLFNTRRTCREKVIGF